MLPAQAARAFYAGDSWFFWHPARQFCLPSGCLLQSQTIPLMNWLETVRWDDKGLVPVIAQEAGSGDVLMFAWMNREALQRTAELGQAVYFSRSRGRLWHKGEASGHVQAVHEIRLDCDSDVVLLKVTQLGHEPGIACHTGRHSCFFSLYQNGQWVTTEPVLKDPASIYK
jgi:phosphoribosyl-AMP cyclohydrolase